MKRLLLFFGLLFIIIGLASCQKEAEQGDPDISDTTDGFAHEEASDYEWQENTVLSIFLNGTSISSTAEGVTINETTAIITRSGNYRISGSLENGQIIVDTDTSSIVRLILNGCDINNQAGPAILVEKSRKTIINLPEGTINALSDGSSYSNPADDPNATLFSKSDLTLFGTGSLSINANYQDGISGKDGLIIKNGTFNITSKDDGLCGKDYLIIHDGNFNVQSQGDGIRSDDASNNAVGYIVIDNGLFKIVSGTDGISAVNYIDVKAGNFDITSGGGGSIVPGEISSKGIKGLVKLKMAAEVCTINSSDDAFHSNNEIEIISGQYSFSTASKGINADESITFNKGNLLISKCDEGLESKYITINDGNVVVFSADDSFNATAGQSTENDDKSCVYINGGRVVLSGSNGDALDSNGSIKITGGTVIIHGPVSSPEVAIDYNGSFNMDGGFLIASGTNSNMTIPPSPSSSQNSVKITFKTSYPSSTLFHLKDTDDNELVTFSPERKYQSMIFSSEKLTQGKTFRIYVTGSHDGTQQNGLFEEGAYSPGMLLGSFTVSDRITLINNL